MTQFHLRVIDAAVQLSADDRRAADARADGDINKVVNALCRAIQPFAQCANIDIVVDMNRQRSRQPLQYLAAKIDALPAEIDRVQRYAAFAVDRTRHANPDAANALVPTQAGIQLRRDTLEDIGFFVSAAGWHAGTLDNARAVRYHESRFARADINADVASR